MGLFTRRSGASDSRGAQSALPAVSTDEFDHSVIEASRTRPVLVDFWAPWCRPCKAMDPVLAELAARFGEQASIVGVDIQSEPALASRLQILSIPLLVIYRDGEQVASLHGAQPKRAIADLIDDQLSNS